MIAYTIPWETTASYVKTAITSTETNLAKERPRNASPVHVQTVPPVFKWTTKVWLAPTVHLDMPVCLPVIALGLKAAWTDVLTTLLS